MPRRSQYPEIDQRPQRGPLAVHETGQSSLNDKRTRLHVALCRERKYAVTAPLGMAVAFAAVLMQQPVLAALAIGVAGMCVRLEAVR